MRTLLKTGISFFSALVLTTTGAFAQTGPVPALMGGSLFINDTIAQFKVFTVKNLEGKNYLHWKVSDQHNDGVYLIYRSFDGIHYSVAGQKKGVGVPASLDIAYYFTDETAEHRVAYYKLVHISSDNSVLYSENACVEPGAKLFFSATR